MDADAVDAVTAGTAAGAAGDASADVGTVLPSAELVAMLVTEEGCLAVTLFGIPDQELDPRPYRVNLAERKLLGKYMYGLCVSCLNVQRSLCVFPLLDLQFAGNFVLEACLCQPPPILRPV